MYIDNIRFVGQTPESVKIAADTFKERCRKVNAIIGSESEITQEDEFLGENYNYNNATRRLTDKTLEKLKYVEGMIAKRTAFTNRQLAGIFGLLFYASSVLDVKLANFFNSLSFYRRMMATEFRWDDNTDSFPSHIEKEIIGWIQLLNANKAIPAHQEPPTRFDLTLYVDASEHGWGCVSLKDGHTKTYAGEWSSEDRQAHKVQSSVSSEPLGTIRAAKAVVTKDMKHVKIFSDHMGLIFAGNRGYGKARSYNEMTKTLQEIYPETTFHFE